LLIVLAVLGVTQGLTPEEIAMFKPRQPDYIERNTGLKAHYKIVDNADGSHTFMGNDIPPHDTWIYPRGEGNPFTLKPQNLTVTFNKDPIFRKTPLTCMPHGVVGISTTGIIISSNFASEKGCPYARDFEELDVCDGHPSPFYEYHHHYYAHCIAQPVCGEPSPIIGVAIDGIPIYGPWDENGRQLTAQDTDRCGGRWDSQGRYKYHMKKDAPFFMDCLMGEIRNDIGEKLHKQFFCTCPYDDSILGNHGPPPPPPCLKPPCPSPPGPGPPPEPPTCPKPPCPTPPGPRPPMPKLICDFTGPKGGMAKCVDTYDHKFVMSREWARIQQTIDLAPCCPKGVDCGYSCKTEAGIKPVCVVEKRNVAVITNVERGYCKKTCTLKCHEHCQQAERDQCMGECLGFCQTGYGNQF